MARQKYLWYEGHHRVLVRNLEGKPPWVAHELAGYKKVKGAPYATPRTACGLKVYLTGINEIKLLDMSLLRPCRHCWDEYWAAPPFGCLRCLFNEGHLWHDNGTRNEKLVVS